MTHDCWLSIKAEETSERLLKTHAMKECHVWGSYRNFRAQIGVRNSSRADAEDGRIKLKHPRRIPFFKGLWFPPLGAHEDPCSRPGVEGTSPVAKTRQADVEFRVSGSGF